MLPITIFSSFPRKLLLHIDGFFISKHSNLRCLYAIYIHGYLPYAKYV